MTLSIRNLFVNYGKLEVLKGISMEIEEGKISVLLGANGSGKSTMLKTISGLNRPVSGDIWFQDRRMDTLPCAEILGAGIGHVPEGRQVFTKMTVLENLELGACLRNNRREIASDIESMYGIFPVLEKKT